MTAIRQTMSSATASGGCRDNTSEKSEGRMISVMWKMKTMKAYDGKDPRGKTNHGFSEEEEDGVWKNWLDTHLLHIK